MRTLLLLSACATLLAGCASNDGPTVEADGPHGALNEAGGSSMNSPTTSPTSSGLSGGTVGSGAAY